MMSNVVGVSFLVGRKRMSVVVSVVVAAWDSGIVE